MKEATSRREGSLRIRNKKKAQITLRICAVAFVHSIVFVYSINSGFLLKALSKALIRLRACAQYARSLIRAFDICIYAYTLVRNAVQMKKTCHPGCIETFGIFAVCSQSLFSLMRFNEFQKLSARTAVVGV